MTHSSCILCNSTKIGLLAGYESHQLGKCTNCGFVFMLRVPDLPELEAHYRTYSYTGTANPNTVKAYHKLLDSFEKYRSNNAILDLGCGRGWFLDEAKKRGWNVYGTEFAKEAIELCERKGIVMKQGDLVDSDFNGLRFDVIFSSEVIEHVNNPVAQFKSIYSSLRPGGLVYITTPNWNCYLRRKYKASYNIIEYPEHLGYFTKTTIHRGLTSAGFKKIGLLTTGVSFARAASSKNVPVVHAEVKARDEKLRSMTSGNMLMGMVKNVINYLLTLTGLGITLKAIYEKPI
jgi:2-polyprenyl-3-methyl-5-hydroxy-6-metoxy-1,4-benzoquinol methylase